MGSASVKAVRALATPKTFGPTRQSIEILNGSPKTVTVFLERLGSEHFRIPPSDQKLTLRPGTTRRAVVEFHVPEKGMVLTSSAIYKAVIKIWMRNQGNGAVKELIELVNVTGTGPGFLSRDWLHCFDETGSPKQRKTKRKPR